MNAVNVSVCLDVRVVETYIMLLIQYENAESVPGGWLTAAPLQNRWWLIILDVSFFLYCAWGMWIVNIVACFSSSKDDTWKSLGTILAANKLDVIVWHEKMLYVYLFIYLYLCIRLPTGIPRLQVTSDNKIVVNLNLTFIAVVESHGIPPLWYSDISASNICPAVIKTIITLSATHQRLSIKAIDKLPINKLGNFKFSDN